MKHDASDDGVFNDLEFEMDPFGDGSKERLDLAEKVGVVELMQVAIELIRVEDSIGPRLHVGEDFMFRYRLLPFDGDAEDELTGTGAIELGTARLPDFVSKARILKCGHLIGWAPLGEDRIRLRCGESQRKSCSRHLP